jgi:hypothetical protein
MHDGLMPMRPDMQRTRKQYYVGSFQSARRLKIDADRNAGRKYDPVYHSGAK